jgi:hypothetical protein
MNEKDQLPPLPEPAHRGPVSTGSYFDGFTAAQAEGGSK